MSQRWTILRGSATGCQSQCVETELDGVACVHGIGPHGKDAQERQNDRSDRNAGSGCAAAGRGAPRTLDFTRDGFTQQTQFANVQEKYCSQSSILTVICLLCSVHDWT
jgi:hypothetical protein